MGRPSKQPTDEQRALVRQLVEAKVSIEEMARRLELAPKTFRKHFAAELGLSPPDRVITEQKPPTPRADAFRPTTEQREVALILAGAQLSRAEIARKMGLAVEVLEEHFAEELAQGPVKCKADILQAMFHAGKGGNVAAAKVYLVFNGQGAPDEKPEGEQPAAIGLLGKKAQADVGARTAGQGTPWETLVSPGSKPN
jgi:AraC-like DNA-binding protein